MDVFNKIQTSTQKASGKICIKFAFCVLLLTTSSFFGEFCPDDILYVIFPPGKTKLSEETNQHSSRCFHPNFIYYSAFS